MLSPCNDNNVQQELTTTKLQDFLRLTRTIYVTHIDERDNFYIMTSFILQSYTASQWDLAYIVAKFLTKMHVLLTKKKEKDFKEKRKQSIMYPLRHMNH